MHRHACDSDESRPQGSIFQTYGQGIEALLEVRRQTVYRARAKSSVPDTGPTCAAATPAATIFPSPWMATPLAWSSPKQKSVRTVPSPSNVVSRAPLVLYRARTKSPGAETPELPAIASPHRRARASSERPGRYAFGMFRMAVGHSDDVDPETAAATIVAQCEQALSGAEPKAGLLFCTFDTDQRAVLAGVRKGFPDIVLIGSTSSGEMSSVLGFREDSVTLALFASDEIDFTAGLGTDLSIDIQAATRQAVEHARRGTTKEPRLCITTPAVRIGSPTALLAHLNAALGEGVEVFGGGAVAQTTRGAGADSYQFYNDTVAQDTVPILLLSGPLSYSFGIDTGWKPVGPRARVTRASDREVHEIDGEPALAFFEKYLGPGAEPAVANPLAVFEDASEQFYLRAPIFHDRTSGSVGFAGGVPENATVQLTVAATEEIFEGTQSALSKALGAYPEGADPQAALVFSCAIRKYLLGTRTGNELEMMREAFGAAMPICGFYSLGEIAPLESVGPARFHNETIVAILLGSS
jgi:hypothetical protein